MKKLVEETAESPLESLMGETVTFFCMNYFYTGKLIGVNDTCVLLENPSIVYETGEFSDSGWKDAQALPNEIYVQISAFEAFGIVK